MTIEKNMKKVAIVTGGSRGIGFAIATELVAQGYRVALTARDPEQLEKAVEQLGGPGFALAIAGRADDDSHQDEAISLTVETLGPIDLLVNNAGINPVHAPLVELEPRAARKIFEVNVLAAMRWTSKVYLASMSERGGSVVNVASVAGQVSAPGIGFYGASKAMLMYLTREFAAELAPRVRVNAVAPATVKTEFAAKLYEANEAEAAAGYPLGRLGVPEDVVGAVSFLASDAAAWITGQTITIDGGLTIVG